MHQSSLNADQLQKNFADLHPNYTHDEALFEASRCLFCYDAPCTRACPTHIDVPRFIREILHENNAGAAKTIFDANIFGGSCGRACPTEVLCEGACVDNARAGAPIQIGRLQRYATDFATDRGLRFFYPGRDTGRRVAIIGSGPAGLSCAHELRRIGHNVSVFEARDVPGGLNTLGIAAYKISRETSLAEIEQILDMEIDLRLNTAVDAQRLDGLMTEYDAVFLAVGLGATQALSLPGEELNGVWEALDFIRQIHEKPLHECVVGRNVVVIGCGNTAIDAATQAIRLGAEKVTIAYRRGQEAKSAYNYEYELGKADGVQFEWFAQPEGFVGANGKLAGITFVRTEMNEGTGRAAQLAVVPGSEFTLECDMAIKALGQTPVEQFLSSVQGVERLRGAIQVNSETFATTRRGLFAGGDCTSKGKEIVNAVQDGKLAARSIDLYLDAKDF